MSVQFRSNFGQILFKIQSIFGPFSIEKQFGTMPIFLTFHFLYFRSFFAQFWSQREKRGGNYVKKSPFVNEEFSTIAMGQSFFLGSPLKIVCILNSLGCALSGMKWCINVMKPSSLILGHSVSEKTFKEAISKMFFFCSRPQKCRVSKQQLFCFVRRWAWFASD